MLPNYQAHYPPPRFVTEVAIPAPTTAPSIQHPIALDFGIPLLVLPLIWAIVAEYRQRHRQDPLSQQKEQLERIWKMNAENQDRGEELRQQKEQLERIWKMNAERKDSGQENQLF